MGLEKRLSVGIIEFRRIPKGLMALNEVIKKVSLVGVTEEYISGGRLIGYLYGSYESVNYAIELIIEMSDDGIIDIGVLGNPHPQFLSYISHELEVNRDDIENILLFDMEDHGTLLEMTNYILHHSDVNLISINTKDYMDGQTMAAFSGSIGGILSAKELVKNGDIITNVEKTVIDSILTWR